MEPMPTTSVPGADGCAWYNLVCQGGKQVADSGLSAITQSISNGLVAMFGGITRIIDESTQVPLADPTYRDVYLGFVGLAVPIIAVIYFLALIAATIRRDPHTLTRATVGIVVATVGGAAYVLFAQFLVAVDDWLAHGVVAVTGADFSKQMTDMAKAFKQMGATGEIAANMLMLLLMLVALVAGVALWVVLLLRKMAILVVVVFAPFLIAGWLWAPTRAWARKATETLIALVFCKTVIYVLFGIGMRLLFRGSAQGLSDFVGVVVLLCGACFAPLVMLRLVHFAADTQLAGEMFGALKAGTQPITGRLSIPTPHTGSRGVMAQDYARGGTSAPAGAVAGGPTGYGPSTTGASSAGGQAAGAGAASSAGASSAGGAAAAAGPAGIAAGAVLATAGAAKAGAARVTGAAESMGDISRGRGSPGDEAETSGPTSPGPDVHKDPQERTH